MESFPLGAIARALVAEPAASQVHFLSDGAIGTFELSSLTLAGSQPHFAQVSGQTDDLVRVC